MMDKGFRNITAALVPMRKRIRASALAESARSPAKPVRAKPVRHARRVGCRPKRSPTAPVVRTRDAKARFWALTVHCRSRVELPAELGKCDVDDRRVEGDRQGGRTDPPENDVLS
ncbi:hypothetical protein [Streptomyces hydrogenans]|uniref:hypothetical protein n=1 Tax=Streptomyces hydrogenans TaxID=1873719 RepID=UPI0036E10D9E